MLLFILIYWERKVLFFLLKSTAEVVLNNITLLSLEKYIIFQGVKDFLSLNKFVKKY